MVAILAIAVIGVFVLLIWLAIALVNHLSVGTGPVASFGRVVVGAAVVTAIAAVGVNYLGCSPRTYDCGTHGDEAILVGLAALGLLVLGVLLSNVKSDGARGRN